MPIFIYLLHFFKSNSLYKKNEVSAAASWPKNGRDAKRARPKCLGIVSISLFGHLKILQRIIVYAKLRLTVIFYGIRRYIRLFIKRCKIAAYYRSLGDAHTDRSYSFRKRAVYCVEQILGALFKLAVILPKSNKLVTAYARAQSAGRYVLAHGFGNRQYYLIALLMPVGIVYFLEIIQIHKSQRIICLFVIFQIILHKLCAVRLVQKTR